MKKIILIIVLSFSLNITAQIPSQEHILHQNPADGLLEPYYTTFTDIDGDGDMDILGCDLGDKKIYWYENTDGQGSYGQQNIIIQQYQASILLPADADGDGDIDFFAAVIFPEDKIIWFENTDGQGHFGPAQLVTTNVDYPKSLHAADINSDGDLDLFSASYYDNKIAWYENDGSGNFGVQQIITSYMDYPSNVTTADIDGDGDLDVLASSSDSFDYKVVWYENTDGQGNFSYEKSIANKPSRSVKTGDFDGDGDIDVIFGDPSNRRLYLCENHNGIGTSWIRHTIDNTTRPFFVRVADINNDGHLDILSSDLHNIYWYENNGSGYFGAKITIQSDKYNRSIETGDINNDGFPEVISALTHEGEVSISVNDNGNFSQSFVINPPSSFAMFNKAVDMDGDGDIDIVGALSHKNLLYYYQNGGQNDFTPISIDTSEIKGFEDMKLVDINNDGYIDIIIADGDDIHIFTFDGNTTFTHSQSFGYLAASSVEVADFIPGGYKEILFYDWDTVYLYTTTNGINYSYDNSYYISYVGLETYSKLITKDIDGDGLIDILLLTPSSQTLNWLKNYGNGSIGSGQIILTHKSILGLQMIDMNNDNSPDILVDFIDRQNNNQRTIKKLINSGTGYFTQETILNIPQSNYYKNDIKYTDLDNDGDNDIVYSTDTNLVFLENDGTNNYLTPQNIFPVDNCTSIQVIDINNDNNNEIVATSKNQGKLFILGDLPGFTDIPESHIYKFNIYPNPVTDLLIIKADNIKEVEIIDETGKPIEKYKNTNVIDFKKYQKGLYLIKITDKHNNIEVQKVLKK